MILFLTKVDNNNSHYILDSSGLNGKPLRSQSKVETLTAKALNTAIEFYWIIFQMFTYNLNITMLMNILLVNSQYSVNDQSE